MINKINPDRVKYLMQLDERVHELLPSFSVLKEAHKLSNIANFFDALDLLEWCLSEQEDMQAPKVVQTVEEICIQKENRNR